MERVERVFTQTFGVVGAIIEQNGKILLVKEARQKGPDNGKWNHPAGWIDLGEDPIEAVKREVEEETGHRFFPENILGVYSLVRKEFENEFGVVLHPIKIIFTGTISKEKERNLADDVTETKLFLPEEISIMDKYTLRDFDIKKMVEDYFAGKKYSLDLLTHIISK